MDRARFRIILFFGGLGLWVAPTAGAVQPAPLPITASTTQISIRETSVGAICGTIGTSSAALDTDFAVNAMLGQLQADATVSGSEVTVTMFGFATGGPGSITIRVQTRLDIDVPLLGDTMSPLFMIVDFPSESGSSWRISSVVASRAVIDDANCDYNDTGLGTLPSTLLGSDFWAGGPLQSIYSNSGVPSVPKRVIYSAQMPAGDHVAVSLNIAVSLALVGTLGSFDDSFKIQFQTLTPAIGNGDMNGDRAVNVVDSTILRRLLVGLPAE